MKTSSILILLVTLSAAYGLRCYQCIDSDPKSCTNTMECPPLFDRCSSVELNGFITKTCLTSNLCISPIKCCNSDLCNSAGATGSNVLLLLVSAAVTSAFL